MKTWMKDALGGLAIGTGILPGVSVGTIGMIVDVYDKLINSISKLTKEFKKSVLTLIPIGGGCLLSTFLLMLFWKKLAYPYFPFPIICALAGIVAGSLPICAAPLKGVKLNAGDIARMIIAFIITAAIGIFSFLAAAGVINLQIDLGGAMDAPFQNAWIFAIVLLVGFIASVACLIPGISGSMVMFIFGLYNPIIGLFISTRAEDGSILHPSIFSDIGNAPYFWGGVVIIIVLLIGMLIGFVSASKAMASLMVKHRVGTFTVVIGFIIGSIVSMFFNNDTHAIYTSPRLNVWWQYLIGGVLFVGFAILLFVVVSKKLKQKEEVELQHLEENLEKPAESE